MCGSQVFSNPVTNIYGQLHRLVELYYKLSIVKIVHSLYRALIYVLDLTLVVKKGYRLVTARNGYGLYKDLLVF